MKYTTNLNLRKPEGSDIVDIDKLNENMDILDTEVASKETPTGAQSKVDTHNNIAASTTVRGHVQLSSATNSTSTTLAATASAVKAAWDLANGRETTTGAQQKADAARDAAIAASAPAGHTHSLTNLTDVTITSPAATHVVKHNGTQWINGLLVANDIPNLNASKINAGIFDAERLPTATTSVQGAISAADKTKLDGIAAGAQVNTVSSVAGRTGAVVLSNTDVSGSAPLASPALTGTPLAPTATTGTNTTQIATTAFVQAGLNTKANSTHAHAISDVTGLQTALDSKANQTDFNTHLAQKVHQGEVHGLRATNGHLEFFDGTGWKPSITPPPKIYGVRVDKNNSNPETRVTYIGAAVGFTPMRGNNGSLQWGSWQNTDLLKGIKPCVLQNLGGSNAQVRYYLNPNNYAQKEDGTSAVITGADGDVMIEIPERWWKFTNEGTTYTVEVSDKPFSGAVKLAHEIENGYNQVPFYALLLTQCIMLILLKSTDTQTALGRGYVDNTVYVSTGNTNTRGLFYGTTNGTQQMKFLGMEDYWGNKTWWIDGLFYNASRDMLIGLGNYNDTGSGYTNHGHSGLAASAAGYINAIQGGNNTGFIPKTVSGSGTTFYADYGTVGGGLMPYFGGDRSAGAYAGGFLLFSNAAAYSHAHLGARLCFKKDDKLYIGAYLGTVTGGRLRSVSGTSEPTGSKTIGAFRTDARANNT